jgi:peptidoglycan hydrolase-like protein with peptidoglycan-binding domain
MNNFDRNCVMGVGAQGDHVRALQDALTRCHGQNVGAIDGIYGERTKRGVINVQARAGIRQDGIYGPRTEDFMLFPRFKQGLGFVGGCAR